MGGSFDRATLKRLRSVEEVEIETSAAPGAERHRTIVWVVVDEGDRVFIRSVQYADDRSMPSMLVEANLPTTLQLLPR